MPSPQTIADSKLPRSRAVWFSVLATMGCAVDLLTKYWVFHHPKLYRGSEWWLWQGHIGIQKNLNEGALFGLGQGQVTPIATFSVVAAIAIPVWLFCFRAAWDRWLTAALGCVYGGMLGNLYDRTGMHGLVWDQFDPTRSGKPIYAVRDWILVQWNEQWVWPNFNIADSLLVVGAGLLMLQSIRPSEATNKSTDAQEIK